MKLGRQKAEGGRQKLLRRVAGAGIRVLCYSSLVACAQTTNDIPPLRPPHTEIPPTFWEQHTTSVSLAGFALLALIGIAIWFATRPKPPIIIPPEVQARNELELLRDLPESGALLSQVSQAMRRYFGAAFALPPGELTTAEFCQAISANDQIEPDLSATTGDFMRRCDERKFAPDAPSLETGAVNHALKLIEQAEGRRQQLKSTKQESL